MKAKFHLSREQNVFLAKRNLVSNIYNSARLEGCNVTFPQTQTILDGVNVGTVTLDDIQTILNLRDAWRFLLSNLDAPLDVDFLCKVNESVSRNESLQWGALRTGNVGISGTEYRPKIPQRENVESELAEINAMESATQRAIYFFLWSCRSQLFWDGNKRNSTICANKILIAAGEGILTIKDKDVLAFNERLLAYYDTGDMSMIDRWMYENCIEGLEIDPPEIEPDFEL